MDNTLQYSKIISNAMQDYEKAITKEKDDTISNGTFNAIAKVLERVYINSTVGSTAKDFEEVLGKIENIFEEMKKEKENYVK